MTALTSRWQASPSRGLKAVVLALVILLGSVAVLAWLLSDPSGAVRIVPIALGMAILLVGWPMGLSVGRGRVPRITRITIGLGAVVAIAGVLLQTPLAFAILVLPATGLLAIALIGVRARKVRSRLTSLPGTDIIRVGVVQSVSRGQLIGLAAVGAVAISVPVWLNYMPAAGIAVMSMVIGVGVAIWRGGLRPSARQIAATGVAASLALVPFRSLGEFSVGGVAVGLSDFSLGLALVVWLVGRGRGRRPMVPFYALALGVFVTWLALTTISAYDHAPVLKEVAKWAEIAIAVTLFADLLRDGPVRVWVGTFVLAAVLAESVVGLVQTAAGLGPLNFNVGGVIRAFGTFDQPNPFGGYLGIHVPLLLAAAIYAPRSRRGWLAIAAIIVIAAVVASRSRGAWLGFGLSTLVLVFSAGVRTRLLARSIVVLASVAFLTMVVWNVSGGFRGALPVEVVRTFEGTVRVEDMLNTTVHDDYPSSERVAHWITGWRIFMANPVLGVGAGNFDEAYLDFRVPLFQAPVGHAHNLYLNMGAEAGLPGMIAISALTAWLLCRGVWIVRCARRTEWEWLAVGTLGASVAFAAHNFVDSLFVNGMGLLFALLIATTYVVEWKLGKPSSQAVTLV